MIAYDEGIMLQGLAMVTRIARAGCDVSRIVDPQWLPSGAWRRIALAAIDGRDALLHLERDRTMDDAFAVVREFEWLNRNSTHAVTVFADFIEQGERRRRGERAKLMIDRAAAGTIDASDLLAALTACDIEGGAFDPVAELAEHWGVPRAALAAFGVGWRDDAWVFPVRGRDDAVVGSMLTNGGDEWAVGSPKGAARPLVMTSRGPLFYAERLIDAVAATAMGLDAIRPLPGSFDAVASIARGREVVVLITAESKRTWIDGAGLRAGRSRVALRCYGGAASLAEWYREGGTQADVLDIVRAIRGW